MEYRAWLATVWLVRTLPLWACYSVATALGWVAWIAWARGRRNATANFRSAFPGLPAVRVRSLARASLINYLHYLVDFARLPALAPAKVAALTDGNDVFWEVARQRAEGRGVVVFAMHFGIWDLPAAGAGVRDLPVIAVVDRFADARLDALVARDRARLGMRVLAVDSLGPSLVKGLRRGGILALLADRPDVGKGVAVEFFGRPTVFPEGPARLALQTGAALVPLCAVRQRRGSPRAGLLADFTLEAKRTGDLDADVRRLTQQAVAVHEGWIRGYPEQWYMFRKLWSEPGVMPGVE
ncbi:MAG: lysophospholipid acyltransferase family protein [Dehalococcoidia bacterium]